MCKTAVCARGAPACNLNVATTCNADGSGFASGGTDCSGSGQTCVNGACTNCPAGGTVDGVRLVEVFVGAADYVIVKNTNTMCPAQLSQVTLRVEDTDDASAPTDLSIGAYMLAPGATALVSESGTTGDTLTSGLIDLNPTAGYAMICRGACATGGTPTVLDALSYSNGTTAPPPMLSPVTFTPIQGIASVSTTEAFVRHAFSGAYPAYLSSDWSIGTATRKDSSTGTCPATQPTTGICTTISLACTYGAITCTCGITVTWTCK